MVSNYCPGSCWSTWPPGGHNTRRPQRAQLVPYLVSINRADVDGWCGWEWDHWFEWHSAGTPLASVHWLSTPKMALVTFSSCCSGCSRCSCSCSCCCCFLNMLLFIYLFFLGFPSPPPSLPPPPPPTWNSVKDSIQRHQGAGNDFYGGWKRADKTTRFEFQSPRWPHWPHWNIFNKVLVSKHR